MSAPASGAARLIGIGHRSRRARRRRSRAHAVAAVCRALDELEVIADLTIGRL